MTGPIKLLRIYTDESAYFGDQKVFEVVTTRARAAGVAGATVLQALVGFGHSLVSTVAMCWTTISPWSSRSSTRKPKLRAFVETLSDLEHLGPVTLEAVEVLRWTQSGTEGDQING